MMGETLRQACEMVDLLAMPAFVLSCDDDGTIRFERLNATHVGLVGLTTEAVRGKTPHECFPARTADTVLKNYDTCRRTAARYEYEELLDLGGKEKWWHTTLSPIFGEEGKVVGVMGVALDITERKARDFRRAESESSLRKLNEEIALFTSMTAHDVRGPLNKIASLSDLTLDGFADLGDNKRDMIETMKRIASGSLKHIDGILSYAAALRLGTVEVATIDFEHLCRDIAAVVDPEAKLDIVSPDMTLDADAVVLQIILRNLVENAARHARGRMEIAVDEAQEGRLTFSVADDGYGFDGGAKAFAEKIRLRRIGKGNRGFGLAAVAHLVESRGGSIWMDAPLFERGTTISFDLPGRIVWHAALSA